MADKVQTDQDARAQLWERMEQGRVSMLWVEGSGQHPQPMTHYPDATDGAIFFITSSETDLAKAVGDGATARMTFQPPEGDYQASLRGDLKIVNDEDRLNAFWSVGVAAWFEHGRDDPTLRLMRFRPTEAAIWASQSSRILVGLKVLNAGLRDGEAMPDISVHRVVSFANAA